MTLPKIPTDNLYKFISLSSIISLLVILIGFCYLIHIINLDLFDAQKSFAKSDVLMDEIDEKISEYKVKRKLLMIRLWEIENSEKDLKISINSDSLFKLKVFELKLDNKLNDNELILLKEFNKLEKELKENLINQSIQAEIYVIKSEELEYYSDTINKLFYIWAICLFIFILLFDYGISMWYWRSQRHLDAILWKESGLKEPEKIPLLKSFWYFIIRKIKQSENNNESDDIKNDKK